MTGISKKTKAFLGALIVCCLVFVFVCYPFTNNYWVNRTINVFHTYTGRIMAFWYQQKYPVRFNVSKINGINPEHPTSLQFGPDGKLYVASQNGLIYQYIIEKDSIGNYVVLQTDTIDLVKNIPNHNDDGTLNLKVSDRQVTGLLVKGTAEAPIIYVTSSDPRIGGNLDGSKHEGDGDLQLDTNSGLLSQLTWNGSTWEKTDLVRGFPRSEENHSLNGLAMDETGEIIYITCGGNTNAGSPSKSYGMLSEYALSASILKVDLKRVLSMPIRGKGNYKFVYNLPTLDDPTRANFPDGADMNDPFGGNDGLNQAKLIKGGPVQVFSPGYRNPYDIVITQTPGRKNRIYTIDNGANPGLGGYPDKEGTPAVTNQYVTGEPGSLKKGDQDHQINNLDNLHLVYKPGMTKPSYGGHPNPSRANPNGAGLFWADEKEHFSLKPTADWPAVHASYVNPEESDFRNPGVNDGALAIFYGSTNGLTEYTASNFFSGALTGDLIAASFNGSIDRIKLNEAGDKVLYKETLVKGFGIIPLDLTSQGNFDKFPGTVWIADFGSSSIYIMEPVELPHWAEFHSQDESKPEARHESGFAEAGGKFYQIGGRGKRAVNVFDPSTGRWEEGAPVPGNKELNHFQAVSIEKKIYVVGAFTGEFPLEKPVADIYIYDTEINKWTIRQNIIPVSRQRGSMAAAVYDNKIYLSGGSTNGHTSGFVNWTDVYDPASDTWKALADAPHKRDHFQAGIYEGKMYVIGGRRTNLAGDKLFSDTEQSVDVYDISGNSWKTLDPSSDLPTPRAGSATLVIQNKILIIGGESKQAKAHQEVEAFDPAQNIWIKMPPLANGRHGTQAVLFQNKIYIVGGCGKQGGSPELQSMEIFYPPSHEANIKKKT